MNRITKLNTLDFSPGIRASYINENFDLLRRWIEEERLRVSGWGIVEGFELSKDLDQYTISVGDGIMIDKTGAHLEIPGETFNVDKPKAWNKKESIKVSDDNTIVLQYPIYSEDDSTDEFNHKIVYYSSGRLPNDLTLLDEETQERLTSNDVYTIAANEIVLMPRFSGHTITVSYKYANDRIDGIFINRDNVIYENGSSFRYEVGESTDTPTCNKDEYIIGYVYWHVDKAIDVEFITEDRNIRQVYVDKNGNLYLMGKLYNGYKYIIFASQEEITSTPLVNDLWYDTDEDILKIWRKDKDSGEYKWFPVNDLARFNREIKVYMPEDNPEDLQTFDFSLTGDKNLFFVPGKNQLTIVVDQIVLMKDQYTELVYDNIEEGSAAGYGFKLIEPLDRASVVEVKVEHNANTQNYTQDLFSKVACFIDEESVEITAANRTDVFESKNEYELGECQLEIWRDGVKLTRGLDFYEAYKTEDGSIMPVPAGMKGITKYYILENIPPIGTVISSRITRFMSTYSNFNSALEPIRTDITTNAEYAKENIEDLDARLELLDKTTNNTFARIDSAITSIQNSYRKKVDKIEETDLHDIVATKINHSHNYFTRRAYNPDNISAAAKDFFSIIWVNGSERVQLVRNLDYTIEEAEEGEVAIILNTEWESNKASLYIETISL